MNRPFHRPCSATPETPSATSPPGTWSLAVSSYGYRRGLVNKLSDERAVTVEHIARLGVTPGEIHLEASGDDVTECATTHVDDAHLAVNYRSACDPRLNPEQASHLA
ncbi:3-deoxy-7-phosphoheptulonate synthase [Streptomyces sp. NPDC059118]|uniref:3-deoxy-7-phosphoheptulonate synthase n=1 Tax=unclassified Streptomyces TaxID=2593676 RepID=UPI0036A35356